MTGGLSVEHREELRRLEKSKRVTDAESGMLWAWKIAYSPTPLERQRIDHLIERNRNARQKRREKQDDKSKQRRDNGDPFADLGGLR